MVLYSEGRISGAEEHFKKALRLDPSYALAHYQFGRLLVQRKDYSEARDELERAVALQPDLDEAYFQLAHADIRLGEKGEAEKALAKFNEYRGTEYSERQALLRRFHDAVRGGP
jgi:predicted Zn-dependent protease